MIKLTIVTVCLNSEKTIRRCIDSIVKQLDNSVEYIVIDGKSSDLTVEIANKYVEKYIDYNISVYSEKDEGIYNAMNKGLRLAKGDWIWFVNSDDRIKNNSIQRVLAEIEINRNCGCIYGDFENIMVSGEFENVLVKKTSTELWRLKRDMVICHPSSICNIGVLRKIGGFNEKFKIAADWDMFLRMYKMNYQMVHIDFVFACFYVGGVSTKKHIIERHRVRKHNKTYKFIDLYMIKDVYNALKINNK